MEKLMIWIIWLIALLIISYSFSPKIVLTPQFAFLIGFLIQAVYAISYVDLWDLDFHPLTLKVLLIGSAVFIIASCCFNYILSRTKIKVRSGNISQYRKIIFDSNDIYYKINISSGKLIFFALLQILLIFCMYIYISRLAGDSFSKDLYYYRIASRNDEDIGFPKALELLRIWSTTSGYIFSYIFLHGLIYKYSNNKFLLALNYILSIFCSLTSGARSGIATIIIVTVVQAYFIYGRSNNWKKKVPFKMLLCGIIILILFFNFFKSLGSLIGRNTENEYYMAVYLSAELKNFDIFIRTGQFGSNIADCYTLSYVVNYLGIILGIPSWVHTFYNPFRTFRGMNLGNVSTIFYANMHDGGIGAVIFFMVLMAFISQIAFINCQKPYHNRQVDLNMIIYPYIFRTILFSFFSNHFYEMVFNSVFIKTIFFYYITRYFLLTPNISWNRKSNYLGFRILKNDRRTTNG